MKGQNTYREFPITLSALLLSFALLVGISPIRPQPPAIANAEPPPANAADLTSATKLSAKTDETRVREVREVYGKLPLSFEVNAGQTDDRVRFLARGAAIPFFLPMANPC